MKRDLTQGNISKALFAFTAPMILGNLLQQIYNIADTFIVGRCLGENALAAVGSTYTLTTFLYSIIIGLCMGSGSLVSFCFGEKDYAHMRSSVTTSFWEIFAIALLMEAVTVAAEPLMLKWLKTPKEIEGITGDYVKVILTGIIFVFLYNYYAFILRGIGNSVTPLIFLGAASFINIALDVAFVAYLDLGVKGAAYATVIAQGFSGIGLALYSFLKEPAVRISAFKYNKSNAAEVARFSFAACIQQSVMNFGILMIQGLVNSFGTTVMAAFTVAVKIDTIAYMPAQEFGNAFSIFISQNYGAKKRDRIRSCTKKSLLISSVFCIAASLTVVLLADDLMRIFISADKTDIINTGVRYLFIEGSAYIGIGVLFLLYGYYRGINKPEMSLILTVISLGTRVLLAYILSSVPAVGVIGIWVAIPVGWLLADITGILLMKKFSIAEK